MQPNTELQRPVIKTALPGPKALEIINADAQYVTPSYPRPDYKLVAEKGYGVWIEDPDGNIFLDCNAGVAVCSTGHCHPEIVKAISDQAAELIHLCGTDYYYRHMPALGKKLDEIVPIEGPTKSHFANSGAEAIETALKLAMYHTRRQKFISFFGSFHGRTLGALSLTSSKKAQRLGFMRQTLDVVHVPYPNCYQCPFNLGKCSDGTCCMGTVSWIEDRLFNTTTPPEEVAGIVIEVVQGEGGYIPAPTQFIREIRRICDEHGIMMIIDEVQSGMGRTGKMFALDHHEGIKADIVCMAKGIGSGMPIGVCTAKADIMDWHKGAHASTFGGNPVAIASALKTIELLEGGLVDNSRDVGAYLEAGLRRLQDKYECIGDVRGLGLMLGVEFVESRSTGKADAALRDRIEMECFNRGLIILGCGTSVIRWSPPLILTKENADVALEIFDAAIAASV
ncbi:MAG TPA: acetyl ornithine aminotransferase family protein [Pyrinomonadaceae bacterium]|nr:acetyl ornithine aminotransferase family protein [Chloracidobacterium sp.]MBP9936610.1 acetyl ornithine aminotransferase family protein [Pyrinomonadaceae bacterium]MBK7802684.1 acetyl ornithine aminotransferase family protein [Chloracidobacterium sp.]MBK9437539.1 acetyl ornithine aminotransferase family protein [Chloracidobacterium sp.]MBL0240205.1 acetyl ornithine aminotransferase family protein [Chloracidobacterium sp.]